MTRHDGLMLHAKGEQSYNYETSINTRLNNNNNNNNICRYFYFSEFSSLYIII